MGIYKDNKSWRRRNPQKRNAQRKRNYDRTRKNGHAKRMKHWLVSELKLLFRLSVRLTDKELAERFGRSAQSIQSARCRWKNRIEAL